MNYLIYHHLYTKDFERAYFLCRLLAEFDKSHYDHFWLLARMNRQKGNEHEAMKDYDKSIEILSRDKKWDRVKTALQPSTTEIIALIKEEKENMKCSQSA